jgi:hypothetical protein
MTHTGFPSTLDEFGIEMTALCAQLSKVDGMTEGEKENLYGHTTDVLCELENEYGVPTLKPEVPEATQAMFFKLHEFLYGSGVVTVADDNEYDDSNDDSQE